MGGRVWGMIANEYVISIWGGENFLELDSGNGCNIVVVGLCAPESYTLKWLKW